VISLFYDEKFTMQHENEAKLMKTNVKKQIYLYATNLVKHIYYCHLMAKTCQQTVFGCPLKISKIMTELGKTMSTDSF
jgi:hypothetical protein